MVQDLDSMLARPEMRCYKLLEKLVLTFYQVADAGLLLGTDAMNTGVIPGFSAHDELADLVAAGLSPWEALHAATVNGAEFLGEPGDRGTVAVGQKADLLLLDANPFDDIANSRRIAAALRKGSIIR